MTVFYVFQGETYKEERAGKYVWSPKLAKGGRKNAGYKKMTEIRKSDFILHNLNGKIVAISIAKTDCFDCAQPRELSDAETSVEWDDDGYRVNTKYFDFDVPVKTADFTEWLAEHYIKESAFTTAGGGKQQYMCSLADEHAIFILNKAIPLQTDPDTIEILKAALADIVGEKESEYDSIEMESINEELEDASSEERPVWTGMKEKQNMSISGKTQREIPKRDPHRATQALQHADYLCEYDPTHRTFLRKNGKPYTEPHHLIPISRYRDFDYSVDIMENIVSLCSHCHNLLHYGRFEDKVPILKKLYEDRKDALKTCGIELTLEQLEGYYK